MTNIVNKPKYVMTCSTGHYHAASWVKLGIAIFRHRLWHLYQDGKWMD
jgi:hypothetical protein